MSDVQSVAAEISVAGVQAMEQRLRDALALARVSPDDIKRGTVRAERRTAANCPNCFGHGIATRISTKNQTTVVVTVDLCSCLEIRITKPIRG